MTSLDAIISRPIPAVPWAEGDNIPWNEPSFSERMLAEHLTQDHDLASRVRTTIEAQVAWMHASLLDGIASRVLDLTCGPGLYLNGLARRGHSGVGIDFSPASIAYARDQARLHDSDVRFIEGDVRMESFGSDYDLVILLYGQLNVFRRDEAADILDRAVQALRPGGSIVLEPQTPGHVKSTGLADPSWSSHPSGLFSAEPHILLTEASWDDEERCATQRFHVIGATGEVQSHAMTTAAYAEDEITALLRTRGCVDIRRSEGFSASHDNQLFAVVATRQGVA